MSDAQSAASPEQTLVVTRLVVGSLLLGLLMFAGIVVFVVDPERDTGGDFIVKVAGLFLVAGVAASLLAGRILPALHRKRGLSDKDLLAQAFFQTTLVRAATLEAAGFLCLIALMLSGNRLALAGATVSLVLLAALFPTQAAWDRFQASVAGGTADDRFVPR